jgi:uncharacterized protein (TIGR03435 family)
MRQGKHNLASLFSVFLIVAPSAQSQEFEVAAVKPHAAGTPCGESNTYAGGRMVLSCFTLFEAVREALDLQPGQSSELTGGSDWVRTERWDIAAKAAGVAGELTPAAYRPMLLHLIEEQFQLKVRSQKRDLKGFHLMLDRKPRARPGLIPNSGAPYRFDLKPGLSLTAQRVSMREFAAWLKMPMAVGQRVEDNTGLRGEYDFVLQWTLNEVQRTDGAPALSDAPSIFTALKEQLGLRLHAGRLPGEVYVIERAQRPRTE